MRVTEIHYSRMHDGGATIMLRRDGKLMLQTVLTRYKSREALVNLVNDVVQRGGGRVSLHVCGWSFYAQDGTSIELPMRRKTQVLEGDAYGGH